MTEPIRVDVATDDERYLETDRIVWAEEPFEATTEERLLGVPADQRFAALVEDADPRSYAGVYGVYPVAVRVPGPDGGQREVPAAGLTWVGVHPDHRRRGVLSAMMRHHLEQVRGAGQHLSVLHASEAAIYGRYGYGLASVEHEVTLGRGTTLTAPHLEEAAATVTTHLASMADPDVPGRMHDCHHAVAESGAVVFAPDYYARMCWEPRGTVRDKEPGRVLFARRDGRDVGFATLRRTHKWDNARPNGKVTTRHLVGETAAQLALARRLVDLDLMGSVSVGSLGMDHPLLHWAGGPRGASDVATYDSQWVRLVDLPGALQDRTWGHPCDVAVAVADRTCAWNDGTWRISAAADGTADVTRSDGEPEVSLNVASLGAAYLGGTNLLALLRAGQVAEHRSGAVAELAAALRTPVAPSAAFMF